ncbi:hypothetical protein [Gluconacetobacter takamatsuzukensis]|uniref:hypothetical protein n=1 Tax=Gluconacetobacter takamatsuzukensis TaxID=1286190 RepID=UPI0030844DDE
MRLSSAILVAASAVLAGCQNKPVLQVSGPPDPFGYLKRSAVCQVGPVKSAGPAQKTTTMAVRSDDGNCVVLVQQGGEHAYASFGVSPAPEHGKAFLYNHNDHTYVMYTPNTAYAGPDHFGVTLIRGPGQPRDTLDVTATVDATGVVVPTPLITAPTPAPAAAKSTSKTATRRRAKTTTHP